MGSCLTFAFFTQVVTGTLLWMSYSPSAQSAWESVYFIQYQIWGGWFLRGSSSLYGSGHDCSFSSSSYAGYD